MEENRGVPLLRGYCGSRRLKTLSECAAVYKTKSIISSVMTCTTAQPENPPPSQKVGGSNASPRVIVSA